MRHGQLAVHRLRRCLCCLRSLAVGWRCRWLLLAARGWHVQPTGVRFCRRASPSPRLGFAKLSVLVSPRLASPRLVSPAHCTLRKDANKQAMQLAAAPLQLRERRLTEPGMARSIPSIASSRLSAPTKSILGRLASCGLVRDDRTTHGQPNGIWSFTPANSLLPSNVKNVLPGRKHLHRAICKGTVHHSTTDVQNECVWVSQVSAMTCSGMPASTRGLRRFSTGDALASVEQPSLAAPPTHARRGCT